MSVVVRFAGDGEADSSDGATFTDAMEIRVFAERVLLGTDIDDKLVVPGSISDANPGAAISTPARPGRPGGVAFERSRSRERFPSAGAFADEGVRGRALHDFANHELLALELMALALLRFVDAPPRFRRGLVATMRDEQRHLQLYLQRMAAHGVSLGQYPVSGFFWRTMSDLPDPVSFSVHMGMTFEQANLDHATFYRRVFADVGDAETADVLDRVLADEIVHVARSVRSFRSAVPTADLFSAHAGALRAPLTLARAKGRVFCCQPRREAGLPDAYIERLRTFSGSKGRPPAIHLFDPSVEDDLAAGGRHTPGAAARAVARDLETLPIVTAASDDVVLVRRTPSPAYLDALRAAGFTVPELVVTDLDGTSLSPASIPHRHLGALRPWGWSPRVRRLLSPLEDRGAEVPAFVDRMASLHDKAKASEMLRVLLRRDRESWWSGIETVGRRCESLESSRRAIDDFRDSGYPTIVVKAPLGTAGRQMIRVMDGKLDEGQTGWIQRVLARQGAVVVEPWLRRVFDLSFRLTITRPGRARIDDIGRFVTDDRGQYRGAILGRPTLGLPEELRRFISGDGRDPERLSRTAHAVAEVVASRLQPSGYEGPVGVDALVYRDLQGTLALRPIVEINPRMNMGHIAFALKRHIARPSVGVLRIVRDRDARQVGHASLQAYVAAKREALPLRLRGEGRSARLLQGVVATTDPAQASKTALMVVAPSLNRCLELTSDVGSSQGFVAG